MVQIYKLSHLLNDCIVWPTTLKLRECAKPILGTKWPKDQKCSYENGPITPSFFRIMSKTR